jgi:hypothetical protein
MKIEVLIQLFLEPSSYPNFCLIISIKEPVNAGFNNEDTTDVLHFLFGKKTLDILHLVLIQGVIKIYFSNRGDEI